MLLEQLVTKLSASKQYEWTRHAVIIKSYATIKEFSIWLSDLARAVCLIPPPNANARSHQSSFQQQPPRRIMHVLKEQPPERIEGSKCYVCKGAHYIYDCQAFKDMTVRNRWEKVKAIQLCFSCLHRGHNTSNCRYKRVCDVDGCRRYQHRILHESSSSTQNTNAAHSRIETQPVLNCRNAECSTGQFFKYVPVSLFGPNGREDIFAMVDEGSAISLIEDNLASRLGLKGRRQPLTLQWYGQKCTIEESSKVSLQIRGKGLQSTYNLRNVCTLRSLDLPAQSFTRNDSAHFEFLPFEDYSKVKPSLLLGLDNASLSVLPTIVQANSESPVAINTKLGKIAYGPTSLSPQAPVVFHIRERKVLTSLNELVTEYFGADNFGVGESLNQIEPDEDQMARQMLECNTRRVGKRFESGLLWRSIPPAFPNSYDMAYKRLLGIERRMEADSCFAAKHKEEIAKYLRNGYARKLSDEEICINTKFKWYLPHFAVHNPQTPEKMKIVFDAAAQANGVALNSSLLKGPERAKPLLNILFKFREGVVAVAADIREMFSQVVMKERDQHAQKFLWGAGNSEQPVQHFVMKSMVFGCICSPCIAEFVKNKNAEDFRQRYHEAVIQIVENHYVDDFAPSFKSEWDAERIFREVVQIHSEGGFQLRSFVSNVKQLQDSLNKEPTISQCVNLENRASQEKVLGIRWNTSTDSFEFQLNFHRVSKSVLEGVRPPTKRELISIVMSVFDPFGIIADFVLFPKILVQEAWKSAIEWDEVIPNSMCHKWFVWWSELKHVDKVQVRRWYSPQLQAPELIQLHVVVDASPVAFAAAAYFRIASSERCDVTFIAGKTRGALQKLLSVPRLEFQAAVLGARLANLVCRGHSIQADRIFFWSDSQTLIQWINLKDRKFNPYVGHRIAEILSSTKPTQWCWIPTDKNTTDVATRPRWPPKIEVPGPWLRGSEFLRLRPESWPAAKCTHMSELLAEEIKPCLHIQAKFSRFHHDYENHEEASLCPELTVCELNKAGKYIVKAVQREVNAEEVAALGLNKQLRKQSSIRPLTPYLDNDCIMRIQGRLDEAMILPIESRRPILMPSRHIASELIMRQYHEQLHHQNFSVTLYEARQKFWFVHAKSLLKFVQRTCVKCRTDRAKPIPPLMGQLPEDRVTPYSRPFTYTGVDLFGPFNVTPGRRSEKRRAVIFTCLTTRAAHLELAHDLSTDAFLLCLRNFINRRGTPVRIRSDNGTNFVGAQRELKESERILDFERINDEVTKRNIDWKFNCPSNPSSGGCWERLIRVLKRLLQKTLREEAPREDTLCSLLIETENILNSRPLAEVPLSSEEDDPITPNFFLVGCRNSPQTPQPVDQKICLRKQWHIAQNLKDRIRKQWILHYLPQLLLGHKWLEKNHPVEVDDLVLICDDLQPRSQWKKGRVIRVFPAKDGQGYV